MTTTASRPKCGFDDVRYLSLVHKTGLSSVNTQTRGAGCSPLSLILFPFIGFWSLLFSSFGKARTRGTVQSATSAKAEPPERKPVVLSLIMAVVRLFLLSGHAFLGLMLLVIGSLSFYTAWMYNKRVYPYQHQVWQQSAMCQRCGTIFVPNASQITLDAVTTSQLLGEQQRTIVAAARPLLSHAQNMGGQMAQKVVQKTGDLKGKVRREVNGAVEPQSNLPE